MFIAAQFTIAKLWNQPRYPSTDEWITKLWNIHTMEFYSGIKKNKIMSFARKMDGPGEHYVKWDKPVTESEGSYALSHMWKLGSNQDTRDALHNGGETSVVRWRGLVEGGGGEEGELMKETLSLILLHMWNYQCQSQYHVWVRGGRSGSRVGEVHQVLCACLSHHSL